MEKSWRYLCKTFSRRLEDVLKTILQDVLKTFWKCLGKTYWRCLEDVFKTSWRCLEYIFARRFEDVLKRSWRHLEDVWLRRIYWSWQRRLQDVLKTSWRFLLKTKTEDVFKASSSRRMFGGLCYQNNYPVNVNKLQTCFFKKGFKKTLKIHYQSALGIPTKFWVSKNMSHTRFPYVFLTNYKLFWSF